MPRFLKRAIRELLRFYLTHTPIKKGRYPLIMLVHKYVSEPITVEVQTKDRGKMLLDLQDLMQYPVYYSIFEAQYQKCIDAILKDSKVIFDVGANIGQYALYFALQGKKVYAFEPMPSMVEKLRRHIALNHIEDRITLITKALTSENGKLKFSLPKIENTGTASLILGRSQNTDEVIEVDGVTLDTFVLSEHIIEPIDLIKIDIEGAELFALRGMQGLLSRKDKPILILEMNEDMMQLAGYHPDDILKFLEPFGYQAFELTKRGFRGPDIKIQSLSENYAFMTQTHLARPAIATMIYC